MIQCPKCHAQMHTYNRNGVQIEQCSGCRGIFLDYGELESLARLESQWAQQAPPRRPPRRPTRPVPLPPRLGRPHQGGHQGGHYGGHHRQKSFGRMLFSS
ncbi:zf-TFIIB domain-containing protein [Streptomyces sp. M10(2022)]